MTVHLTVKETAGLARYGYPVSVSVPFPRGAVQDAAHLALERDGKTLGGVQYDALSRWADGSLKWALVSFNLSPGPLESTPLTLRFGEGVSHPDPGRPVVQETADAYVIRGVYRIPKTGGDFITSVKYGDREFLRKPARWSVQARAEGISQRIAPVPGLRVRESRVLAAGPVNVVLQLTGSCRTPGGDRPYRMRLAQPNSKSWFDATLELDSDQDLEVRLSVPYVVEKSPARYDFGVGSWVYGTLDKGMTALLDSNGTAGWGIRTFGPASNGPVPGVRLSAVASSSPLQPRSEGWAHLIDGAAGGRAIAFGSPEIGEGTQGQISVGADGETSLDWVLTGRGKRSVRALFHHVFDPVQVTAVTSPASMLHPLEVTLPREWVRKCRAGASPF